MGITSKKPEDDNELPGSGMKMDLDVKMCPVCRREAMPWDERCAECDVATVAPDEVPAAEFALPPGLAALAALEDDEDDEDDPTD